MKSGKAEMEFSVSLVRELLGAFESGNHHDKYNLRGTARAVDDKAGRYERRRKERAEIYEINNDIKDDVNNYGGQKGFLSTATE
jgi:hypothetical protein